MCYSVLYAASGATYLEISSGSYSHMTPSRETTFVACVDRILDELKGYFLELLVWVLN